MFLNRSIFFLNQVKINRWRLSLNGKQAGTYSGGFEDFLHGGRYFRTDPVAGNQRHFSDFRAVRACQELGHVLRTKRRESTLKNNGHGPMDEHYTTTDNIARPAQHSGRG